MKSVKTVVGVGFWPLKTFNSCHGEVVCGVRAIIAARTFPAIRRAITRTICSQEFK